MSYDSLRRMLESELRWPNSYRFKFVIPAAERDNLVGLLQDAELSFRESEGGRYVSVTAAMDMASPDAVIEVYQRVQGIKGLVSL